MVRALKRPRPYSNVDQQIDSRLVELCASFLHLSTLSTVGGHRTTPVAQAPRGAGAHAPRGAGAQAQARNLCLVRWRLFACTPEVRGTCTPKVLGTCAPSLRGTCAQSNTDGRSHRVCRTLGRNRERRHQARGNDRDLPPRTLATRQPSLPVSNRTQTVPGARPPMREAMPQPMPRQACLARRSGLPGRPEDPEARRRPLRWQS